MRLSVRLIYTADFYNPAHRDTDSCRQMLSFVVWIYRLFRVEPISSLMLLLTSFPLLHHNSRHQGHTRNSNFQSININRKFAIKWKKVFLIQEDNNLPLVIRLCYKSFLFCRYSHFAYIDLIEVPSTSTSSSIWRCSVSVMDF